MRAAEKGWSEAVEIVNLEMCGSWRATAGLLGTWGKLSSRFIEGPNNTETVRSEATRGGWGQDGCWLTHKSMGIRKHGRTSTPATPCEISEAVKLQWRDRRV